MRRALPWVMIFSAGFCLRLGISSLSPVLSPIRADLQVSDAALGVLTTIPVVCMGSLSVVAYGLERRIGLKGAMLAALGILFVGLALRLEPSSYGLLLVTAGMIGIADAIIRPLLSGFIKASFSTSAAAPMSIYAASMGMGSSLAAFATAPVNAAIGRGWSPGLAVWSIPVALAWATWAVWRDRSTLNDDASAAALTMRSIDVAALTLVFGLQAGVNYTLIAWLPTLCASTSVGAGIGGALVGVFVLVQCAVSLFYDSIERASRLSRASSVILFSVIGLAGCLALPWLSLAPWFAPVMLGIATGALFPIALILPLDFSADRRSATRLSGITQSGGYLLGGLLPWIVGVVIDAVGIRVGIVVPMIGSALLLAIASLKVAAIYRHHGIKPARA